MTTFLTINSAKNVYNQEIIRGKIMDKAEKLCGFRKKYRHY